MDTYLGKIQKALIDYLPEKPQDERLPLYQAIVYMLQAKSKLIRPLLVCAVSEYLNEPIEKTMVLGCALEYVHTYSLIHDDLPAMDDDEWRRGQKACHLAFGEDVAILAGDCLQIFSVECLVRYLPQYYDPSFVLKAVLDFSAALGIQGMAGGQQLDLSYSKKNNKTFLDFESVHQLKTGALLLLPFKVLSTLCGVSDLEKKRLIRFGEHFGFLFQAIDDILDVIGTKKSLGKTPQKDVKQNKLTVVEHFGLKKAISYAKDQKTLCQELLSELNQGPTSLFDAILELVYKPVKEFRCH